MKKILCSLLVTAALSTPLWADETIAISELPKEVVAAIEAHLPGSTLLSAEKEEEDGKLVYEVKVRSKDARHELEVTADGTILKTETKRKAKQ